MIQNKVLAKSCYRGRLFVYPYWTVNRESQILKMSPKLLISNLSLFFNALSLVICTILILWNNSFTDILQIDIIVEVNDISEVHHWTIEVHFDSRWFRFEIYFSGLKSKVKICTMHIEFERVRVLKQFFQRRPYFQILSSTLLLTFSVLCRCVTTNVKLTGRTNL